MVILSVVDVVVMVVVVTCGMNITMMKIHTMPMMTVWWIMSVKGVLLVDGARPQTVDVRRLQPCAVVLHHHQGEQWSNLRFSEKLNSFLYFYVCSSVYLT